eukprot:9482227-Pyramimonas_sp.AAC.1
MTLRKRTSVYANPRMHRQNTDKHRETTHRKYAGGARGTGGGCGLHQHALDNRATSAPRGAGSRASMPMA